MWMTIIMLCGNMYANSCLIVTSKDIEDYYATKEECFQVAMERADFARATPQIAVAVPMCQEIILGEEI